MDPQMLFTTDFWYIAPSLSAVTVFIAGLINGKFNIVNGFWSQLVAWITGAVLSVAAWFFELVTVGEPTWLAVTVLCVVVGLSCLTVSMTFPLLRISSTNYLRRRRSN